jgi:hypothetical protein
LDLHFKEETSEMLRVEYSLVWCRNLDTSECRSEMSWNFWNSVLEKDEINQMDRSCERWMSITKSQWGNEHYTYNKAEERITGIVTSCVRPAFRTRNWRKDRGHGRTRK